MARKSTGLYAVVRNTTMSGRPIIEGVAQVIRALGDGCYRVRFADGTFDRFVAQEDLHGNLATAERHAKEARAKLAKKAGKRAALALAVIAVGLCDPWLTREAVAAGNMACADRDTVLSELGLKYKESPKAVGLANNGGLIEVLTSDDGSTWTIIVSMPNGTSCLLAAGEDWQPIERERAEGPEL